jgi:hypothetical protein
MANPMYWPGSSSYSTGSSPFGFYDSDPVYIIDSDKVANYCAIKLGYPVLDVELQDIQLYACFEEAISVYSEELYHAKIKDNYLSLEGAPTSSQLNNQVVVPSLNNVLNLSETYGTLIGIGGYVEWYTASLDLIAGQQVYDMQAWARSHIPSMSANDRIVVQRIFYDANPAINQYYDPFVGGSINYQGTSENFGWASYSPGLNFVLFPVYWDIARIQEIEMSNQVRRSGYSFELINNKLRIFPKPENDGLRLHFNYSLKSEMSNLSSNSPYSGSTGLVTNPSNAPYGLITYSQINQPGKQWIYEYTLALASELLGLVRGKYTSNVPIPGSETTLNSADLISKGKDQQQSLRERLRQDFEEMSRKAQLERKQVENQVLNETLQQVPLFIYIL